MRLTSQVDGRVSRGESAWGKGVFKARKYQEQRGGGGKDQASVRGFIAER